METTGWTALAGHLAGTRRWRIRWRPGQRHLSGYQEPAGKGHQALVSHRTCLLLPLWQPPG